jgi:hypothetical protein
MLQERETPVPCVYDARSKDIQETSHVKEGDRQLESIALNADCMDQDVADVLFGDFEDAMEGF